MPVDINFERIRPYRGSRNNGFEELCCQLAGLEPPSEAAEFVRKEGSGGDAGVECYWRLGDGTEHAWQAKYFFKLGKSQWQQIDDSVRTALKKRSALRRSTRSACPSTFQSSVCRIRFRSANVGTLTLRSGKNG